MVVTPAAERRPSPTAAILARSGTLGELSAHAQRLSGAVLGEYDLKSPRQDMSPNRGMSESNSVTLHSSDRRFKRARPAVPEAGLARFSVLPRESPGPKGVPDHARPRVLVLAALRAAQCPYTQAPSGHAGPMR